MFRKNNSIKNFKRLNIYYYKCLEKVIFEERGCIVYMWYNERMFEIFFGDFRMVIWLNCKIDKG